MFYLSATYLPMFQRMEGSTQEKGGRQRLTSNSRTKTSSRPLVHSSGLFCRPALKDLIYGIPVFGWIHNLARASNDEIRACWVEAGASDLKATLMLVSTRGVVGVLADMYDCHCVYFVVR